ncbi:MAG: hypothetical protein RB145_13810 [Armatimonadota bacterium]|nr:hypothetical protein [Armatimonadota bacterium]
MSTVRRLSGWALGGLLVLVTAVPIRAKVGDPLASFTSGPVIHQLRLNPAGQMALGGMPPGRTLHRFVSDDGVITVDAVVEQGAIDQLILYLPGEERRGFQVNMFLQHAVGSVFGAQKGMLAFRAAVLNRRETALAWGGYTMRFTPMEGGQLRVLVSR